MCQDSGCEMKKIQHLKLDFQLIINLFLLRCFNFQLDYYTDGNEYVGWYPGECDDQNFRCV